jgi:hypothetical protein
MSDQTIVLNQGNQAIIRTDLSRIFVGKNRYLKAKYNNSDYAQKSLRAGQVLGRVTATGWLKECVTTATDGSQTPIGVLGEDIDIAGGALVDMYFCSEGDVVADKLIWSETADTLSVLDKTVSSKRIRDYFQLAGIKLITENTELSNFDNE